MASVGNHANNAIEEDMIRHMILNTLRSIRVKFSKEEWKELVIACDSRIYWRKDFFPHYKFRRKKYREDSGINWNELFRIMSTVKAEIKETFPYRLIEVEGAEADDIIGTLIRKYSSTEPIMIVSRDKDFIQLHAYPNVQQWDNIGTQYIKDNDPVKYLKEMILKGDDGDDVPNYLMEDETFIKGIRQKPITKKRLEVAMKDPKEFCDENQLQNYARNSVLIDLRYTPKDLQNKILELYHEQEGKTKKGLTQYFMKHRLQVLHQSLQDF